MLTGLLPCVHKFQTGFCTQGWEETVDAAVAHLLKTCLSKSSKEQALNLSSQLSVPKDTSRLKKHITLLCDRLAKGGRLCVSTDAAAPQAMVMPGKSPAALPKDGALPIREMRLQLHVGLNLILK